ALMLIIMSCNLPAARGDTTPEALQQDQTPTGSVPIGQSEATTTPTDTPTTAPVITDTVAPSATPCTPTAVANTAANVRSGPGTVYNIVGALNQNASAAVAGKSSDGTWWYIEFPAGAGGHAWISGSVVTASCIPAALVVVAAPPTPLPPSGTCKDGYVYRLIRNSDKVCVSPASKAQADADNAAASSRKLVNTYGPDACAVGYVWREAYSGDHVCVTAATRSQAAADNAAAASRWVSGAYGPHTCIAGFVWREATSGDDVCVTGDVRSQAAADNAAASSRTAISAVGADACISGYVWREAFSGDHVCVTPAVKGQVAADNAAAPSHTWP
ncbi:MAG TPA: SH3 domain-containing protein, partial [Anaerolineales bacterium]|nr:SH3 domain-containing protein [Anaerolineales bacterium]